MTFKKIVCKDGFEVSVQAGEWLYCEPREEARKHTKYTQVECGFPSAHEPLLEPYKDGLSGSDPTQSVYGYVPVHIVELVIMGHGGIVSGQLPGGVRYITAEMMEQANENV